VPQDDLEAVKIAGEWTKQLALWATGTLVLSIGFLKDFLKGQKIEGAWWWCLIAAWFFLICSLICGHLGFGAPLTGAGKSWMWKLRINTQTRWLSGLQLVTFVLGLAAMATFAAFHISGVAPDATPQWKPAVCVGPFVQGSSDQLEPPTADPEGTHCGDLSSLAPLIGNGCAADLTCRIILIGSADKRPLTGKLLAQFGSNEGLARARAEWLRTQIATIFHIDSNRFLVLTVGPGENGNSVPLERLRFDRAVKVQVIESVKSPPAE
jgi:hypothetical protein